jgi:hypothetical protein
MSTQVYPKRLELGGAALSSSKFVVPAALAVFADESISPTF